MKKSIRGLPRSTSKEQKKGVVLPSLIGSHFRAQSYVFLRPLLGENQPSSHVKKKKRRNEGTSSQTGGGGGSSCWWEKIVEACRLRKGGGEAFGPPTRESRVSDGTSKKPQKSALERHITGKKRKGENEKKSSFPGTLLRSVHCSTIRRVKTKNEKTAKVRPRAIGARGPQRRGRKPMTRPKRRLEGHHLRDWKVVKRRKENAEKESKNFGGNSPRAEDRMENPNLTEVLARGHVKGFNNLHLVS